ncbi:MAG TPA: DinB family protein [Candidatus Saccharimonadales bacterium]|nr:DinB family protein [Candidatus Saccharimonadales bacterium]
MNRETALGMWNKFRAIHGVTLRAIAKIPPDKLEACPVPGMRSFKELVTHMYEYAEAMPKAVVKGKLEQSDLPGGKEGIRSVADLEKWCRGCFDRGDANVKKLTDAQVQAMVPTFFGRPFMGFALIGIVYDEHLHHRGQLYAFLRAVGVEPPFMWGFDQNEPAFRPAQG